MSEIFSDSARGNPPKNIVELKARLKSIERCINNDEKLREVSIEFCKRAFRLLADCGLITEENVRFLSDAESCKTYDTKHIQRFYRDNNMCVLCGGQEYLIANNWFGDGRGLPSNRRAFYNWVAEQTQKISFKDKLTRK